MPGDHPTVYLVVLTEWPTKKPGFQAFLNYFLFRGIVTQGRLGGQRINAIVCGYYFCLIYSHRLLCCLFRYLTMSILIHPHRSILINTLGWRCRELHSSPQCLHYKGITTISLLYDTAIYVSTRSDPPLVGFI